MILVLNVVYFTLFLHTKLNVHTNLNNSMKFMLLVYQLIVYLISLLLLLLLLLLINYNSKI